MPRRARVLISLALFLAPLRGAIAADQSPTLPPSPLQQTVVHGTLPNLAGRWLAVGWVDLPGGGVTTMTGLWEIATADGQLALTHRFVELPPDLKAAIEKANQEHWRWAPSREALAALARGWDTLSTSDAKVANVQNQLAGHDGFDEAFTKDERTRDARFLITQRFDMSPAAAPVLREIFIYAVLTGDENGEGYGGNFDTATIAAAPLPIPIHVQGTFWMYPLGPPPAKGFLARLLGSFAGCGRR
jgi:hypothetical protein